MPHKIPKHLIDSLIGSPSASKVNQVSRMQNYIQDLLSDSHHTFLQGSYKNDTAISDINDVDIVAMRLKTYSGSHSPHAGANPLIAWNTIFSEIEEKLRNQDLYDWTVERDDKCIKIRGSFNADVVPAVKIEHDHLEDPIAIFSFSEGKEKMNRPRTHYQNGVRKNQATGDNYKPTVRMFKNWVINHFPNDKQTISSFKMECLVHHQDNDLFSGDYAADFVLIGNKIVETVSMRNALATRIPSICGTEDISSNWSLAGRQNFISKLKESIGHAANAYMAPSQAVAEASWRKTFNLR